MELNPQIQPVFEAWKKQGVKKETLWSELEKNQELKSLLLVETPWLAQAADEQEQRQRIGLLFDLNTMNYRMGQTVEKLKALQKGMEAGAGSTACRKPVGYYAGGGTVGPAEIHAYHGGCASGWHVFERSELPGKCFLSGI